VHNDDCQRILAIALPVTVSEHFDARLDFDQTRLGGWKHDVSREKECGQGLLMSAAQAAPRDKQCCPGLRNLHNLILNGDGERSPAAKE
jgi:hypothetical protein